MKKAITASDPGLLLFGSQFESVGHETSQLYSLLEACSFKKQEVTLKAAADLQ